jgi:hypothetical protein
MKKLIAGVVILGIALGFYFYQKKSAYQTTNVDEVEFAISDISKIDRIVMKNRDGVGVDLIKKDKEWFLGDQKAFDKQVESLLENTISKIKVRGPVSSNYREYVIRQMATSAIKVSIYANNKNIKTYYVGEPDQNNRSTYMYLEGSNTPYETHIPGFEGFLTPRFHVIPEDWIDRILFDYEPDDIKEIKMTYNESPDASFTISREGNNYFVDGKPIASNIGKSYFMLFKFKGFEGYPNYLTLESQDSIRKSEPMLNLVVTPTKGVENTLKMWYKGRDTDRTVYDKKGNVLAADAERYFALSNKIKQLVVVQDYVFGKMLVAKRHFFEGKNMD